MLGYYKIFHIMLFSIIVDYSTLSYYKLLYYTIIISFYTIG